ncbi:MAG: gamma-glutamylcyclotransferase family protein [Verrucomicrobiae bacterium]|nr:gamma-glutamylcyclotransferase family protein [Verrucomicrobiae bacterium]
MNLLLFVYDKLRKDFSESEPLAKMLAMRATHRGQASVLATLFDLGDFPAIISSPTQDTKASGITSRVLGDLYEINSLNIVAQLDKHYQTPHLFLREKTMIFRKGEIIDGEYYRFVGISPDPILVHTGDYSSYIKKRMNPSGVYIKPDMPSAP